MAVPALPSDSVLRFPSFCFCYSSVLTCDSLSPSPPIKSLNMLITVILNPIPEICVVFCSLRQLFVLAFSIPYKFWPWSGHSLSGRNWDERSLVGAMLIWLRAGLYLTFTAALGTRGFEFLKCPCSHLPDVSGFPHEPAHFHSLQ